jgi:hypothetical protein
MGAPASPRVANDIVRRNVLRFNPELIAFSSFDMRDQHP